MSRLHAVPKRPLVGGLMHRDPLTGKPTFVYRKAGSDIRATFERVRREGWLLYPPTKDAK